MRSRTFCCAFWTVTCIPSCTCVRIRVLWVLVISPCVLLCVSQCFPLYLPSEFGSVAVFSLCVSPAFPVCYLCYSYAILARYRTRSQFLQTCDSSLHYFPVHILLQAPPTPACSSWVFPSLRLIVCSLVRFLLCSTKRFRGIW